MSDYLGKWLDILYTLYAISHVERLGQCCFCFAQELAYQIYLRLHMKLLSHTKNVEEKNQIVPLVSTSELQKRITAFKNVITFVTTKVTAT